MAANKIERVVREACLDVGKRLRGISGSETCYLDRKWRKVAVAARSSGKKWVRGGTVGFVLAARDGKGSKRSRLSALWPGRSNGSSSLRSRLKFLVRH